jgi:hypothetical protein
MALRVFNKLLIRLIEDAINYGECDKAELCRTLMDAALAIKAEGREG